MNRFLLAFALAASSPAIAQPLTVHPGETWLFTLDHGEPSHARKADSADKPARGEVKVNVRTLFGTMMTITNNSAQAYTFQAQLIGPDGKAVTGRTCTLPSGNQPALENWPQKATAVQIGNFRAAGSEGRC